jgi:DNA primase
VTILDLLQLNGLEVKQVASTWGGEYASACPWCGGTDRFRSWPNQGAAGRYWCRQCNKSGDAIQFLRDYKGLSFRDACDYLGMKAPQALPGSSPSAGHSWEPRLCASPGDLWQKKASHLVKEAVSHLLAPAGKGALEYLIKSKGLKAQTIQEFLVGWIPADRWDQASAWNLPELFKDNGQPKKLWFPKGHTIPWLHDGRVIRVRFRRPDGDPRYLMLRGSSSAPMTICSSLKVAVLVESELDAMLIHQEAEDLVQVVALGNAQARPDQRTAELLGRCQLILVALDTDQAGAQEAWRWWPVQYPQAKRWPPIRGKDPGEMIMAGVDLRRWLQVGLYKYGQQDEI